MIPGDRFLLIAVLACLMTGCASTNWQIDKSQSVTPQSYSIYRAPTERSVGRLRKILFINVTLPTPSACVGKGHPDYPPPHMNANYLNEVKGYDVVDIYQSSDNLTEAQNAAIRKLVGVAEKVGDPDIVLDPVAVGQLLLSKSKFDALMMVESSWDCLKADPGMRWGIVLMTLGLDELNPKSGFREIRSRYRATLFEAGTGRPVWQSHVRNIFARNDSVFDERKLFGELEQAVPALLTQ